MAGAWKPPAALSGHRAIAAAPRRSVATCSLRRPASSGKPARPAQALRHNGPAETGARWQEMLAAARPLRPDMLLGSAAAAVLLLSAQPQLDHVLQPASGISSPATAALAPQPRWQQWEWHWLAPPAPPLRAGAAAAGQQQQPPQQHQQLQQRQSEGNDRPFELDAPTAAALGTCMVVAALANSAGIGGGAFIVPLISLGLGMDIKTATALSQAAIAGGALGSVACTLPERHPTDPGRPLIDYRLALVITPMLLLGCNTGVMLNQLLPSWAVTLMLIPLLLFLTYRTGRTAWRLHDSESRAAAAGGLPSYVDQASSDSDEALEYLDDPAAAEVAAPGTAAAATGDAGCGCGCGASGIASPAPPPRALQATLAAAQERARRRQQRRRQLVALPWQQGGEMVLLWTLLLGFQVGRGHYDHCSWQFAALCGGQAAVAAAATAYFIWKAVQGDGAGSGSSAQAAPAAAASPAAAAAAGPAASALPSSSSGGGSSGGAGDVPGAAAEPPPALAASVPGGGLGGLTPCSSVDTAAWGPECLAQSAGIALAGGSLAGLCGIGGGMILSPLMLELGVHPLVSQATASTMVLFSSSSAAASFAIEGRLPLGHAAAFGAACAAAAFVGVGLVSGAVKRSGRASVIVWLLTGIVGVGAALTLVFSGADAAAELLSGRGAAFGAGFCGPA